MKDPLVKRKTKRMKKFLQILKWRREGETSTSGRYPKDSFSDEHDKICLKTPYEEDVVPGIKPSYTW